MKANNKETLKIIKYWPVLAVLIVLMISLGTFLALRSEAEPEVRQEITTSTISTGDIRVSAFGSGRLIAAEELQVGFETAGSVKEILVETGDMVQEGDVLAVLYDEDLVDALANAEAALRELTSDASVAEAALELAEAQKDVLTAQSTLSFYLSPYVYKSEIRLRDAQAALNVALNEAQENPSDEADQLVMEAQEVVDHAELSLALNWETYYEEYVPDFFNFAWRDRFGFWHDYYDPPSELEVSEVWAELAAAEARVEEFEYYLAAMTEGSIPEEAYGSRITALERAAENVAEAMQNLESARLTSPMDGMVIEINLTEEEIIGTKKVITIARMDPPTLDVSLDEGDWSLVKEGSRVEVVFDALPEKTYLGEVIFVDPSLQASRDTNVVNALVALDVNAAGWAGLPLSSAASIELIAGETSDAVLLPIEGLQESSAGQGVVLVESDGEFISREIELGLWDVLFVEVLDGLNAGDVVLIGELN
jgi:multidrug efflux pump subunit AcrA (membrane-fusion protein)